MTRYLVIITIKEKQERKVYNSLINDIIDMKVSMIS